MISQDTLQTDRAVSTRRQFLSTAAVAASIGIAGCESATEEGSETDSETVATVRIDGAANGLQKYRCTVEQDGETQITAVEPNLIAGDEFQIVTGGVNNSEVTARAADLSESVEAFEGTRTLFTVTFDGTITAEDVNLRVGVATDDEGETIPPERLLLTVE